MNEYPTFQGGSFSGMYLSICFQLSDWSDDEGDNVDSNVVNRSHKVCYPLISYSPHMHTLQHSNRTADTISDDDDDPEPWDREGKVVLCSCIYTVHKVQICVQYYVGG